jgi:hypothetical protein
MYPYLFTFTFLALMGIFTTHTFHKATQEALEPKLEKSLENIESKVALYRSETVLESLKEKTEKNSAPGGGGATPKQNTAKTPPSLNYSKVRPPSHAHLNLYPIIAAQTPHLHSHYTVFARLIDLLYDSSTLPHSFVERLIKELKKQEEVLETFSSPEDLATLAFRDEEVQKCFSKLLKGNLLHYITFNTQASRTEKKLCFLFIPSELLQAICPNQECYQQLEDLRREAWKEIDYLEENRTQLSKENWKGRSGLKKELIEKYDILAGRYGKLLDLKKEFDFSLGKKGNVAFVYDTVTGKVVRTAL